MMKKTAFVMLCLVLLSLTGVSAVTVNSVDVGEVTPGKETTIGIEIENILDRDVEDVSVSLQFTGLPFTPVGSSEGSVDKIEEDDEERFVFRIKASNNIEPGDYAIPYTIKYFDTDLDLNQERKGTVGVKVNAQTDLSYVVSIDNPVVGQKATVTFKIVNKGFGEARFVSVSVNPSGYTILSEKEVYVGNIDSDDFETATFDVLVTGARPNFNAIVEYRDFDNNKKTENINEPIIVYSQEKAEELGIITKSYTLYYVLIAVLVIVLWFVWRAIKKRRRMNKSMAQRKE